MSTVLALGCHPDDIEFMMAGTLFLLKRVGCAVHTMCLANGSCGTTEYSVEEIVALRRQEAFNAAKMLGSEHLESLVNDLEVYYSDELVRKLTAVIRSVKPEILLLPSPEDYMEDHMNTSRLGVTAAFCRGMPNFQTLPAVEPTYQEIVLYHALPYGLTDGMRRPIEPDAYIDVGSVIDDKQRMLACHKSQKKWLDESQGLNAYLITMREMSRAVGRMSGRFEYAEGWRRHAHLGFSAREIDPLRELLADLCWYG